MSKFDVENAKKNAGSPLALMAAGLILGSAALGFNATPLNDSIEHMVHSATSSSNNYGDFSSTSNVIVSSGVAVSSSAGR